MIVQVPHSAVLGTAYTAGLVANINSPAIFLMQLTEKAFNSSNQFGVLLWIF